MRELTAWEIIENARFNLEENLPIFIPAVKNHPIYLLGVEQLNSGLKKLRGKPTEVEEKIGGDKE